MDLDKLDRLEDSGSKCLRCGTPMKSAGDLSLHEGEGTFLGLCFPTHDRIRLSAEACPKCGKVEFFL